MSPASQLPAPVEGAEQASAAAVKISIVVPCWRDDALPGEVAERWLAQEAVTEIIIAAAGATHVGQPQAGVRVVHCAEPGRGHQMNAAARLATGDVLLFQHADTELTEAHLASLSLAMADPALRGGAFRRQFDERHPRLRWIEPWEALRCRKWGPLFGDQSIFVRRTIFKELGGFADIPLMEDVEFTCRLRRAGGVKLLLPSIRSSARKHLQHGSWRTTLTNALMLTLYVFGVSPRRLHARYYLPRT